MIAAGFVILRIASKRTQWVVVMEVTWHKFWGPTANLCIVLVDFFVETQSVANFLIVSLQNSLNTAFLVMLGVPGGHRNQFDFNATLFVTSSAIFGFWLLMAFKVFDHQNEI